MLLTTITFLFLCGLQTSNALPTCAYNGQVYQAGDSFKSTDGCNTCNCMAGIVGCTEMLCVPINETCYYNGTRYLDGDSYDSIDGCNKCFCFGNTTACTERGCITTPPPTPTPTCTYHGRVYQDGVNFKADDGCNTCNCQAGRVSCTLMACPGHVATANGASCLYSGLYFSNGASFTSTDGCNQCTCTQGKVHCTTYPCPTNVYIDPNHCYVKGKTYDVGQSYPSLDGCNSCFCGGNNTGFCTEMFCLGPVGRSIVEEKCYYNGVTYTSGEHFDATDGCNHCFCAGNVPVCTKMGCSAHTTVKKRATSSTTCLYGGHTYHVGDSFKDIDDCNTCGCSPGGFAFCTEMFCIKHDTRETVVTCSYEGATYQVGQRFKHNDGCNTCSCSRNGQVLCTYKACPPTNLTGAIKRETIVTCSYEGATYQVGQRFKHNDGCNTCSCSRNGRVLCTYRACPPTNLTGAIKRETIVTCSYEGATYQVGQRFKHNDGCNTCSCSRNGQVLCTYKACPPTNLTGAIKRETIVTCSYEGATYQVGQRFKHNDGCNTCSCSRNGQVLCTYKACPPTNLTGAIKRETIVTCSYEGATYQVGQRFKHNDGCNTCSCSRNGQVLCTYKACPPTNLTGAIKRETIVTCSYEGATYQVGQHFKHNDGCNTCSCSRNGQVLCTYKACPPTNLTGAIKRETIVTCSYEGATYQVGQRFKHNDGCNTCSCSRNGQVLCTYRACPPTNLTGAIKRETIVTCSYEGATYEVGQRFKHNDGCNTCSCSRNGQVLCTYRACPPINLTSANKRSYDFTTTTGSPLDGQVGGCHYGGRVYWAGNSWGATDGCNTCYCSAHGGSLCTTKPCGNKILDKTTTTRTPESTDCKYDGKTYSFRDSFPDVDGCNTCYCAQNNFVECTKLWHCTFGTIGKR